MEPLAVHIHQEGKQSGTQEARHTRGYQVKQSEPPTLLVLLIARCRENRWDLIAVSVLGAVSHTWCGLSSAHSTTQLQARVITLRPHRPGHPPTITGVCVAKGLLCVQADADVPSISRGRAGACARSLIVSASTGH